MENKPYYALTVKAETDEIIRMKYVILRLTKIDQYKIVQGSNLITLLRSRESLERKLYYNYTEKIQGLEDTYSFAPTRLDSPLTPLNLLLISKNTTPYDTLAKLHSYIATHSDICNAKVAEEVIKDTSKYLRHTFKQLFLDDNVNEAVIDTCATTRQMTIYIKQVGLLYYSNQLGPIRF